MDDGERIHLLPRGGDGDVDGAEEGDGAEEKETSFGGGGVGREAQERGARPKTKTKTKTKTSSHVNLSYEDDKNEDIDAIINKMLIGEKLTKEEKRRLKQFKEEEKVAIETTNYEDGSIEAGGYVGSIMISNKEGKKFYFYGVAKNNSINEFKRNYPNMDKSKLESLEFGMSEDGKPVVKIRRINGKPYSIDHEERKYTKGERKGQRMKYDTIKEVLGKSLYDEIEGREGTINELNKANEELKKTIEEIRKKAEDLARKKKKTITK